MYVKKEPEGVRSGGRHRVEAFARRLEEASQAHPRCPTDAHRGKQKWLRDELKSRFGVQVSAESVSKWYGAKVMPRPSLISPIASALDVNEVWLVSGVPPMKGKAEDVPLPPPFPAAGTPALDAARPSQVFLGAVDLVAGMAQMSGGTVAFPGPREHGLMFVLLNGKSHAVQVVLAQEVGTARYSISVPKESSATAILTVVPGKHPFDARFLVVEGEMRTTMAGSELLVEKTFRGFASSAGPVREIASLDEL